MTSQDRDYFMLRAKQEQEAARCSPSRTVRGRHEELAWLYQMRVQFSDRADSHDALDVVVGEDHTHVDVAA
jgi:hypothetical protein